MSASVLDKEVYAHSDNTELPNGSAIHAHEVDAARGCDRLTAVDAARGCERQTAVDAARGCESLTSVDTPHAPGDTSEMLFARYTRTHDPRIRDRLVLCHEKLVRHLAARFANRMESIEDLIQVGNIGLIKAIDRFEPSRHLKFATYAVPTIVGEIQRHLRDKTWSISVARPLKELYVSATRVKADLTGRLGRVPTVGEVATELHISEEELLRAMDLDLIRYTVSFGNPLQLDYDASHLTLSSALGETDESLGEVYTHVDLDQAIAGLEPNERAIIIGSYFKGMTQADIGKRLKVSQMQVSRLHRKALMRLKARLSAEP